MSKYLPLPLVELSLLDPDMLIVHCVAGVIQSRDRMGVG